MADQHRLSYLQNIVDTEPLQLDGVTYLAAATVDGTPFLFASSTHDNGLSVFRIAADGTLIENTDNVNDGDNVAFHLTEVSGLATAVVAGTTYLFAASDIEDGVSVFSVSSDGTLSNVANIGDDSILHLNSVRGLTTATVVGTVFLFASGSIDDGISVFSVASNGALTNVDNVSDADNPALQLDDVQVLTTAEIDGTTFLFAGGDENGFSVFSVASNGALTHVQSVADADDPAFKLINVSALCTAEVDGTTYLYAFSGPEAGVSIFSVASDGTLTNIDNVALGGFPISAFAAAIQDGNYLCVTNGTGASLLMFRITDDGTLTQVDTIKDADDPALALQNIAGTTHVEFAGNTYIYAAATLDDSVSAFAFGGNEAPQFSFDPTPLSFGENTVNTTPQAVFAGVTVADSNFNLDGGTLIVRGHLAEDTIGILSDGAGAGQIDLTGGVVSYEGTEIGTASGGAAGADLVVDFVPGVTSAGVEALIGHLTYVDSSDTPTASRDIEIVLRDGDGAGAVYPGIDFATGGALSGLSPSGGNTDVLPVFADIDGDGDFDAIFASSNENFFYYENTGTADSPAFLWQNSPANNPFSSIPSTSTGSAAPALADLDHDGDLDLLALNDSGTLVYYENIGTRSAASFDLGSDQSAFSGLSFTGAELPTFVDLDNDGDYDLVVGSADGAIHYFENTGTSTSPAFVEKTGTDNPFDGVDAGSHSYVSFADVDQDGDLDAIVGGTDTGGVAYLENIGDAHMPVFDQPANPLAGFDSVIGARGSLVDIDGDGDTDAVFGDADGGAVTFAENLAPARGPAEFYQVGGSPFDGLGLRTNERRPFSRLRGSGWRRQPRRHPRRGRQQPPPFRECRLAAGRRLRRADRQRQPFRRICLRFGAGGGHLRRPRRRRRPRRGRRRRKRDQLRAARISRKYRNRGRACLPRAFRRRSALRRCHHA